MVHSILASLALFGASASAMGAAHVVNKCSYDIYTSVVPAEGGGQEEKCLTLSPGDSWDQQWTPLTNGAGWSIKFSKEENSFGSNILQYEYTSQSDGTIWYDLSCVDGTPWKNDWKITSDTDNCIPRQAAYRFSTDDAHGMQNGCPDSASITVTLCSSNDNSTGDDSGSSGEDSQSSAAAEAPAYTPVSSAAAEAPAYTPASSAAAEAPAYTPASSASAEAPAHTTPAVAPVYAPSSAVPTTLATVVSSKAADNYVATVVKTVIAYQTAAVTQGDDGVLHVYPKRHQHHPHGHGHAQ